MLGVDGLQLTEPYYCAEEVFLLSALISTGAVYARALKHTTFAMPKLNDDSIRRRSAGAP